MNKSEKLATPFDNSSSLFLLNAQLSMETSGLLMKEKRLTKLEKRLSGNGKMRKKECKRKKWKLIAKKTSEGNDSSQGCSIK